MHFTTLRNKITPNTTDGMAKGQLPSTNTLVIKNNPKDIAETTIYNQELAGRYLIIFCSSKI